MAAMQLKRLDVYDPSLVLSLDVIITAMKQPRPRKVSLASQWDARGAVSFGRRALEVAIDAAGDAAEQASLGDLIEQWQRGSELAAAAGKAVSQFNVNLAGRVGVASVGMAEALAAPIRTISSRMMPELTVMSRHAWAEEAARTLAEAEGVLLRLSDQMLAYRNDLATKHQNDGKPDVAAFVRIWAEAWVYLTGRLPGTAADRNKNPFLDLVDAAWLDAGGQTGQSFMSALRIWRADNRIQPTETTAFIPSWA